MNGPTPDPVATTGKLTVALRSREAQRPERLYHDPFAHKLADAEGYAFLDEIEALAPWDKGAPITANFNAIRTRFFDDLLLEEVRRQQAPQVVIAAAGLDCRSFRLPWPSETNLYEIDYPEVMAFKNRALSSIGEPRCTRRVVAIDLRDETWPTALCEAGYDPRRPSVWLIEGLLYYLHEPEVHALLAQIRALTAPGSLVAADLVNEALLSSPLTRPVMQVFENRECPYVFGTDDPRSLWEAHGMKAEIAQPGEPCATFGRWDSPVPPEEIVEAPRAFLVHGRRV